MERWPCRWWQEGEGATRRHCAKTTWRRSVIVFILVLAISKEKSSVRNHSMHPKIETTRRERESERERDRRDKYKSGRPLHPPFARARRGGRGGGGRTFSHSSTSRDLRSAASAAASEPSAATISPPLPVPPPPLPPSPPPQPATAPGPAPALAPAPAPVPVLRAFSSRTCRPPDKNHPRSQDGWVGGMGDDGYRG